MGVSDWTPKEHNHTPAKLSVHDQVTANNQYKSGGIYEQVQVHNKKHFIPSALMDAT